MNDPSADEMTRVRRLFPELFCGDQIDWAALQRRLGAGEASPPERYGLTWVGKAEALAELETPPRAVLQPCPAEGVAASGAANCFIEGDNLETLKLLAADYAGQVDMIYIDPPYNTGNDFIYTDNYAASRADYLRRTGQTATRGCAAPETSGRYHAAWLTMLYPRLVLARRLLRDNGAICVSIGDREVANLRLLLNEIFGEENYRNTILVRCHDKNINRQFIGKGLLRLNVGAEYVLVYARSPAFTLNPVYRAAPERRQRKGYWKGFWNAADRPTMRYELLGVIPQNGQWKWQQEVAAAAVCNYQEYLAQYGDQLTLEDYWEQTGRTRRFIRRNPNGRGKNAGVEHWVPPSAGILRTSNWTDLLAAGMLDDLGLHFDSPKNVELIAELIRMAAPRDGLILDFFAGSATTAQAVLELNRHDGGARRFLLVQLPAPTGDPQFPTIAAIAKERIRRVIARLYAAGASGDDLGFMVYRL